MTTERRLSFGGVAEQYDRSRPSYPGALIDDVIAYSDAPRALEVGAGTGKATVLFAERGVEVLGLEPSPEMARLARHNCARYEHVTIEQIDFERFSPGRARFGLLYSAQAWHWVEPDVRYVKARAVLRSGGALAVFWTRPRWEASALRDQLRGAYERAAPEFSADPGPMHPATEASPELWGDFERQLKAAPQFEQIESHVYDWAWEYSTDEYLQLLQTHSDHILLGRERQAALLAEVGAVLYEHGGSLPVSYATVLCLARAS